VGFPLVAPEALKLTGKRINHPVVRYGVVACISREDVRSLANPELLILLKNMLLINATSLQGNSGSSVISTAKQRSDKASIIGVVQGHFSHGETRENLDLGIVIPTDRIQEIIDCFK
jgi:hypothetical protein